MDKFSLQADEALIMRKDRVATGSPSGFSNELVLTNKHLICVKKGLLGGTKDVLYYPLQDIKIVDNKPQVLVGKHRNGLSRIEVYLLSGEVLYFSFDAITKMEVSKWVTAITKQLYGHIADGYNPITYAIPGSEVVAETLKGTIDTFKSVFNKKSSDALENAKRPVFCQSCGARYEGINGKTVTCPYCGTPQYINDL